MPKNFFSLCNFFSSIILCLLSGNLKKNLKYFKLIFCRSLKYQKIPGKMECNGKRWNFFTVRQQRMLNIYILNINSTEPVISSLVVWKILRVFYSYFILSVYSWKPSQPSETVNHQGDHRGISAVAWIFSHIFTGSLCFTSQLLHRLSLLVLYASRARLNGSVWLCAVCSQKGKQPLLRSEDHPSSSLSI